MTILVQISRCTSGSPARYAQRATPDTKVIEQNIHFEDEEKAQKFVDEFGLQWMSDSPQFYRAEIAKVHTNYEPKLMHVIYFDEGRYEIRSEFVNMVTAKDDPAIQRALSDYGVYGTNSKGEVVSLQAGMATPWDFWTTTPTMVDDLNHQLKEM